MSRRKGRRFRATSVALSPEVLLAADICAKDAGMSRSEYLRRLVETDAGRKLLTELGGADPQAGHTEQG